MNIPSSATATPVKQSLSASSTGDSTDVVVDNLSEQFHRVVSVQSTIPEPSVTSTPVAIRSSPPSVLVTPPPVSSMQCYCEGDVCSVCLSPLKANEIIPIEEKSVLETKCKVSLERCFLLQIF